MTTAQTVRAYFDKLSNQDAWQSLLADDVAFTSFTSPIKQLSGKENFVAATSRFYGMVAAVEVRELIVEGKRACALTRYQLQPPGGAKFTSDVAELFTVNDGRITSFAIYFDSAPYPKPPASQSVQ